MSDDIKFEHLSDREILILTAQAVSDQGKRLNSHASRLKFLERFAWVAAGGFTVVVAWLKGELPSK